MSSLRPDFSPVCRDSKVTVLVLLRPWDSKFRHKHTQLHKHKSIKKHNTTTIINRHSEGTAQPNLIKTIKNRVRIELSKEFKRSEVEK